MFIKKLTKQVICNPDEPVVSTPNGKLRGLIVDDTYIFRGIKYADAKRFHMPEPVQPWEGIKDAIIYGAVCPEIQTVQPGDNYTVPHVFYPQDEDCQYLNIWTQSVGGDRKRPVLVWLHGGGFATGSGIEHFAYDGENMSRYGDVVVVTLNHRLNVLGFLDLSAYGEEYRYSANLGMADLVEALRWIRKNIACFGGDPDNVTIFGQSGGGGKVAALLQIPSAEGLFHRAVIQSGIIRPRPQKASDESEKSMAEYLLEALELTPERVSELETVPYYRFQQIISAMGPRAFMNFGPKKDDDFYIGSLYEAQICEHAKKIPVIVGNVLGEFCQNFAATCDDGRKNTWSQEKAEQLIREKLGEHAEDAMDLFRQAYPENRVQDLLFTDRMFRTGTFDYLNTRAAAGLTNTYGYMFTMEQPVYGGTLPWHNAEIPYVFHNADYIEPSYIPGITEQLQDIVCACWCSFAQDGKPKAAGMPEWKPYIDSDPQMMYFDEVCKVKDSEAEERLSEFLASYPFEMQQCDRSIAAKYFGGGPRV